MDNDQIKSIIYDWLNSGNDWHELSEDAESEHKDIDEAWEDASDLAADYIENDLEAMVSDWLERHGNQIIDMIREKLEEQEPDEVAAVERLEQKIRDMSRDVARTVERGNMDPSDLPGYIIMMTEDMDIIRKQIAEITGEEDDE